MALRIHVRRRTLVIAALAMACVMAPMLDVDQRLADGIDIVREGVSQRCSLVRTGTPVRVEVSSLEGALTTCQSIVRAGTSDTWELAPDKTTPGARQPQLSCELTRGPYAWAAIARVKDVHGGSAGSRVCAEMLEAGWLPRSEVLRPG